MLKLEKQDYTTSKSLTSNTRYNVDVEFYDVTGVGMFYQKPENRQYNINTVIHCRIRIGATIESKRTRYVIKAYILDKDTGMYFYYLQEKMLKRS